MSSRAGALFNDCVGQLNPIGPEAEKDSMHIDIFDTFQDRVVNWHRGVHMEVVRNTFTSPICTSFPVY